MSLSAPSLPHQAPEDFPRKHLTTLGVVRILQNYVKRVVRVEDHDPPAPVLVVQHVHFEPDDVGHHVRVLLVCGLVAVLAWIQDYVHVVYLPPFSMSGRNQARPGSFPGARSAILTLPEPTLAR